MTDWAWQKVVFVGPSAVGKTALVHHICEGRFPETTSAGGVCETRLKADAAHQYRLQDIGFVRMDPVIRVFCLKADVIVLMYDVTSPHSLETMVEWHSLNTDVIPSAAMLILLGNKIDERRAVTSEEGLAVAIFIRAIFMEISAKDINHVKSFVKLLVAVAPGRDREERRPAPRCPTIR